MKSTVIALTVLLTTAHAQTGPDVKSVVDRYVTAIGGAPALQTVTSRVVRGTFDNGRGLTAPFVSWIRRPDHIATVIGQQGIGDSSGSGRATDGRSGWDKNFIGTGLRDMSGAELADFVRMADPFRAAHLLDACTTMRLEEPPAGTPAVQIIRCDWTGGVERWWFDRATGLVDRAEFTSGAGRATVTHFSDYRAADGILTPFQERIVVPGATVIYAATTVRYNETVPDSVFARPAR